MAKSSLNAIKTIVSVKTIKGTSFVGVRNYTNSKGEVSNQTFVLGISYANLLKNDLDSLINFDLTPLYDKYSECRDEVNQAYSEMLESLVKRTSSPKIKAELLANGDATMRRSKAQTDAYDVIDKGLKAKDGFLYLYGLRVRKEVLVPIDYPSVNSGIKTIIKRDITKQANLRGGKFISFKLGRTETLKIQGAEIG